MVRLKWRHFFCNKILVVSMIVMLFIPIIYGGIFLGSVWDPYGKTANLPVAMVNLDKSAQYGDKTLALGDELVNELKDNRDLEWHVVSQQQAEAGLNDGDYYMIITVPEDFSQNAARQWTRTRKN